MLAVISEILKMKRMKIIDLIAEKSMEKIKKRKKKRQREKEAKYWWEILSQSMRLHDRVVAIIMIVTMSTSFFGYCYFREGAEQNNSETRAMLEESKIDGEDYLANKVATSQEYLFNIESHHDYGVTQKDYDALKREKGVAKSYAILLNKSTRLSYHLENLDEKTKALLSFFQLRQYEECEDAFSQALYEGENAMIKTIGYEDKEEIYGTPSIGMDEDTLMRMEKYVVAGEINLEKLKSGQEVLLCGTKDKKNQLLSAFHIGEALPLSDVLLNDKEDTYEFASLIPGEVANPIYEKMVKDPESGTNVNMTAYAFGKRKEVPTKVGVLMQDGLSVENEDRIWYQHLALSKGMTTTAVSFIKEKIQIASRKIMGIYYVMMILVILVGMLAIGIRLYTKIRMSAKKIAYLRGIGATMCQIKATIWRQNFYYLIIDGILAVIPTVLCQCGFFYITRLVDSGKLGGGMSVVMAGELEPIKWWQSLPYRYDLFSYQPIQVGAFLFFVFLILISVVTLPQLWLLKKQEIVKEMNKLSL